jgi:hypothetical protein
VVYIAEHCVVVLDYIPSDTAQSISPLQLLDIKPFVPEFDMRTLATIGWYKNKAGRFTIVKYDGRFIAWFYKED